MTYRAVRRRQLKCPPDGIGVITYDSQERLLDGLANVLDYEKTIVVNPYNGGGNASYDVQAGSFPSGTRVLVEDVNGAGTNSITITAEGAFVDQAGTEIAQVVIDTDDGFALLMVAGGVTLVQATKGCTLS